MKILTLASRKGELSRYSSEGEGKIAQLADFLDLMGNCPAETIVLERDDLAEAFFDLKSGLAGDFLQKISNYRRRLIILGDLSDLPGKALKDFIYESNKTGKIVFALELEGAIDLLR
jgi:hypothetical protein